MPINKTSERHSPWKQGTPSMSLRSRPDFSYWELAEWKSWGCHNLLDFSSHPPLLPYTEAGEVEEMSFLRNVLTSSGSLPRTLLYCELPVYLPWPSGLTWDVCCSSDALHRLEFQRSLGSTELSDCISLRL